MSHTPFRPGYSHGPYNLKAYSLYTTATRKYSVGLLYWAMPPTREFCVGDTNTLISKNAKVCVTPNANVKICVTPTQTPNAKGGNIGRVGSPIQNSCFGHVDFMLFVLISLALGNQREPSLQWSMGLSSPRRFLCLALAIRPNASTMYM